MRYHFLIHGVDDWLWRQLPSWAKGGGALPAGGVTIRVFNHEVKRCVGAPRPRAGLGWAGLAG
jgi:hypothetical protein